MAHLSIFELAVTGDCVFSQNFPNLPKKTPPLARGAIKKNVDQNRGKSSAILLVEYRELTHKIRFLTFQLVSVSNTKH